MGLTVDALSKATPTRLICRGGRWVLELTRLEAVDRDVFQPRLTRLEGADSILAALRRSDEGQGLVSAATQLMRTPRVDEDRVFDVSDGDFVPSSEAAGADRLAPKLDSEQVELSRMLADVRAELVVLRASHARLRDRVMALEASQSGLPQAGLRLPRGGRSRRRSEPPPPLEPAAPVERLAPVRNQAAFAATQASPGLSPPPPLTDSSAAAVSADLPAQPTFEELARSLAGEQLPTVLKPPTLAELNTCMSTLMDRAPVLELVKTPVALDVLHQPQGCKLLDDEGKERGLIVLDLTAAVLLGAGLLSLPRDEALRQVNENDVSEDALLATSEICNNITGPVNAVAGNAHVRSTALSSVDVGALPRARARLDMAVEGGHLILLMF
jgi:hypothetical protein